MNAPVEEQLREIGQALCDFGRAYGLPIRSMGFDLADGTIVSFYPDGTAMVVPPEGSCVHLGWPGTQAPGPREVSREFS